ncbi:MAG TPA: 4Fe-4S dicluster domain-containing protein [Planctomycetota bacterium]|nr:4Fe-4S dicluster domain-containing protein [Planctomycetota bacterium]
MLLVRDPDRIRILAAVATRGAVWQARRVIVITASLAVLAAVPAFGLARVDLWDGRHLLLGERVGALVALRGVVVAIAALWGITFLSNMIVGRFFCGWGCPVGYVSRLGEDVDLRQRHRLRWLAGHAAGAGFVGTFIAALMSWWVDPRVLLEGSLQARAIVLGLWLLLCIGGFLHAFAWRFGFCRSACPIGLYYRYVTSKTPIGLVFDEQPSPCIECGACVKICPVDLDPRKLGDPLAAAAGTGAGQPAGAQPGGPADALYGDAECIRCGDCVEACRMIFKSRPGQTPPLRFGRPGRVAGD